MTRDETRMVIQEALSPGCFFVSRESGIHVDHSPVESIAWEIFRGHLLDRTQTRLHRSFESWSVSVDGADAAVRGQVLSVKVDWSVRQLHVTRNVLVYAWEPDVDVSNVVEGQERQRWVAELIGTIELATAQDPEALRQRLIRYLFLAVVGTSRLPITSLESPLPGFSLGQFAYLGYRWHLSAARPLAGPREVIELGLTPALSPLERAKLVELALRAASPNEVASLAELLFKRWHSIGLTVNEIPALVRTIFNHVALSPYTTFVDNLIALLVHRAARGLLDRASVIDIFSYLLRHLVQHLTAYDLKLFHNLGANYPDALMLDALLKNYLVMIERHSDEFEDLSSDSRPHRRMKRRRRRALRQAWLLRKLYEDHAVPDAPTSPGENLRVLPEPFVRVPDEQILQPHKRHKKLFAGDPIDQALTDTPRRVLEQSVVELGRREELVELGRGCYLDRPLGSFKQPGEVDRTTLLSYGAFSRRIAQSRLEPLRDWGLLSADQFHRLVRRVDEMRVVGVAVVELEGAERPGVVALENARRAAVDFVFLRTTPQSLADFLSLYDFAPLRAGAPGVADWLLSGKKVLLIRGPGQPVAEFGRPLLTAFDEHMRKRIELGVGQDDGLPIRYLEADGTEYLAQGLRVLRVWETNDGNEARDFTNADVRLPPHVALSSPG